MSEHLVKILMVEDDRDYARVLAKRLRHIEQRPLNLEYANTLTIALQHLDRHHYDLVLLDLSLPDSGGLGTLLKVREQDPKLPIVVLTGSDNDATAMKAIQEGAQDYIIKGSIDDGLLIRALHFALERDRIVKKWQRDWQSEKEKATHDPLTGLVNRALFQDRLIHSVALASRRGEGLALLYLDLDHFKKINDRFGHTVGDQLLIQISRRLETCIREEDTLARLGGDEFVVILMEISRSTVGGLVAERITNKLVPPFLLGNHSLMVTCSIGISLFPSDSIDPKTLLEKADLAMYRAKQQGGNKHQYFQSISDSKFYAPGQNRTAI